MSEGDEKKSVVGDKKISLAASIERGSFFSLADDLDLPALESPRKALRILTDLDLDKISELKHIYNICDIGDSGVITVQQVNKGNYCIDICG